MCAYTGPLAGLSRDVEKQYNPISSIQLKVLRPNINFDDYFLTIGIKNTDIMNEY